MVGHECSTDVQRFQSCPINRQILQQKAWSKSNEFTSRICTSRRGCPMRKNSGRSGLRLLASATIPSRSLEFQGGWFRTCIGQSQLYPIRLLEGEYVIVCMTGGVQTSPVLPDRVKCHSTRVGHSYLTFGHIIRTQAQKAGSTSKVGVS